MAYRTVFISNPAYLHVNQGSLILTGTSGDSRVPLEDIGSIVVEHRQLTMSAPFMSECARNDVAVFLCDDKYQPAGISLPFQNHVRQHKRILEQVNMTVPLKKRLWQMIIQQKIINQGTVLKILQRSNSEQLINIASMVSSGDATNIESYAARLYFSKLFAHKFQRFNEGIENAALNYGYAIVRGGIARSLVAYGFIPSIGIHHRNEYNNFNLADDLIEPLRPLVDLYVVNSLILGNELTTGIKAQIVAILGGQVRLSGKKISAMNAIEQMVKSLVSAMTKKNANLIQLPEIVPFKYHSYV